MYLFYIYELKCRKALKCGFSALYCLKILLLYQVPLSLKTPMISVHNG